VKERGSTNRCGSISGAVSGKTGFFVVYSIIMPRIIFSFFLVMLIIDPVFTLSLEEAIGAEKATELISRGNLTEVQVKNSRPLLLPGHYTAQSLINSAFSEVNPVYIIENLYLYTKPAGAISGNIWTEAERNGLFNRMTALSVLAGLEYYSISDRGMRTLYETSTRIDRPEAGNPLPDPAFQSPPALVSLYARQKDKRFGENTYQYDYHTRDDALIMIQKNLTDMKTGPIRIIRENNLRTILSVIDTGDHLLIYAVSLVNATSFPGMKKRIGDSFTNRTAAIVAWISEEADKAFGRGSR
jgi:hypothetical protein